MRSNSTKSLKDPIRPIANFQFQLPVHLKFRASRSTGSGAKATMWLCLFGLALSLISLGGKAPKQTVALFGLGAAFSALFAYVKQKAHHGVTFEIQISDDHLRLSKNLIKGPDQWNQYADGEFLKLPWADITDWRFQNLGAGELSSQNVMQTGSGANEHWIQLKRDTGKYLVIDRELMLEVEDEFVSLAQRLLSAKNKHLLIHQIPLSSANINKLTLKYTYLWLGVGFVVAVLLIIYKRMN